MNKKYLLLTIYLLLNDCAISSDKKTDGTFPIYGNYCGFDYPKSGVYPIPIDKIDLACKNHDKCYDKNGFFNKKCDENIINELIPRSVKTQFFKAMLDSVASEHGARMTEMHKATDNAQAMQKELKITYNKARQAAITKEILEIVGGAEALNG